MHYHFGYPFNPSREAPITCITQGTDGTNFGMKTSPPTPFGSVDPTHTKEGILIYDFYSQASGDIVLRLGDDGEYEVPGIAQLDVTYNTDQVMTMTWSAVENMYEANDSAYTAWATAIPVDEEYCVQGVRIPVDLPTQPTALRVDSSTDTSISLLWDASTAGTYPIANYRIEADEVLIGSPTSNAFTWNACPPNEEVVYRVKAVDNQGNIGAWSTLLVYTNEVDLAPIYLMTEPLFNDGSFDYLVDSSGNLTDVYYGKLLTSTDTAWNPTTGEGGEYPQDGTIDFSGGNKADTQWEAPQDQEWTMSGVYNVVSGVSYDMYSIHYKTGNLCDIYLGSDTEDLTLSESDKDYTPPTGNWIIEEEPPSIIFPETGITTEWHYICIGSSESELLPPDVTNITTFTSAPLVATSFLDINGSDEGWTLVFSEALGGGGLGYMGTHDETGWMSDYQMAGTLSCTNTTDILFTFGGLTPSTGTYRIQATGNRALAGPRELEFSIAGHTAQTCDTGNNYGDGDTISAPNGMVDFIDVVPDASGNIVVGFKKVSGTTAYLSGINIVRTS